MITAYACANDCIPQAWARAAAAKKEKLIKSTVERMMRLGASNSVRYAWNRWCRFVRTRLKEEAIRIKQAWAEDVRQKQEDLQEEIQRARQRMAAKRKSASELCLHQHWKRRVTRCFNLWVRWQTRRRRDAAERRCQELEAKCQERELRQQELATRCQETEVALKHSEASAQMKDYDAANLQHEISAMLALHEHTCKARNDAKQMSEAAVGHRAELDLAMERQSHEKQLAALTQTNQRLRNAVLNSLAEAAGT